METFQARAEAYIGTVLQQDDFRIRSFNAIPDTGLSRSVGLFTATSAQQPDPLGYVLLLEQSSSPVIVDRNAEYEVLRALQNFPAIKAPHAYWIELDPAPLGAPFLLTGLLPGSTNPKLLLQDEYGASNRAIVEQGFGIMGALAAIEVEALALGPIFAKPSAEAVWQIELGQWEKIIHDSGCTDLVATSAALRHLKRFPPPTPPKLSLVHGDFRIGNYLFDGTGVTGVIDWEMTHIGSGLEDLGWALLPTWDYASRPGLHHGVLTRAEAVRAWERTSRMRAEPEALDWWILFGHIKSVAIWATARHLFVSGKNRGIMPALVGYAAVENQEKHIVHLLKGAVP